MTRIIFRRKCLNPIFIGAVGLALLLAGCGGDDEKAPTSEHLTATSKVLSDSESVTTGTQSETPTAETTETQTGSTATSPEDQQGGAGDEQPAYTLALFTGRGGRISPRVVRVPAFISIRVELRSADGKEYGLAFGTKALNVSGALSSVSTTLDGMRAGAGVVGTPLGTGNGVRIEATAEPGP
jgi:cytoskeletal protein RodZ